jgi:ABC-type uncharacterized transport system involved in gliding motility auxiliary subunit
MLSTKLSRTLGIIGSTVLALVVLVAFNVLVGKTLRDARWDATQGNIYTLTQGSKRIAQSPKEPINITLYYSGSLAKGQAEIESYAKRVRELLDEYARVSQGKVRVTIIDPEPNSENEDAAVAAGLQGVPAGPAGENFFFGLVGTNSIDTKEVIPFFDTRRDRLLEYDLSKIISNLANPKKRVVGYISSLQVEGGFRINPQTRQPQQTRQYRAFDDLKSLYEVRNLGGKLDELVAIPEDVDVLLLAHAKNLPEPALYAIDQFILKGGRTIVLVDPLCETDTPMNPQAMPDPATQVSELSRLLGAYGVEVPSGQLAADQELALAVSSGRSAEQIPYVVWLKAQRESLSKEDPITSQVQLVHFASSGFIQATPLDPASKDEPRAKITPLITTTSTATPLSTIALGNPPDPKKLYSQFVPGNQKLTLVARLEGSVRSAFASVPKNAAGEAIAPEDKHLATGSAINVLLLADADVLADALWVREMQFLPGMPAMQKLADNGDMIVAAVDNLAGSTDLVAIRSRDLGSRPFTRVEEIRKTAERDSLKEKQRLEEKVEETRQRISQLRTQQGAGEQGLVLSSEQQEELAKLQQEFVQSRKDLRKVNLSMQREIDRLGWFLRVVNIALVPATVIAIAMIIAGMRWYVRANAK